MSAILYGNLSAEIVSGLGTRIERVTLRQAATDLFQPQRPRALPSALGALAQVTGTVAIAASLRGGGPDSAIMRWLRSWRPG